MELKEKIEEVLEQIRVIGEEREKGREGSVTINEIKKKSKLADVSAMAEEMAKKGWVEIDGDNIKLTAKGDKQAVLIVRRNRLAERLLSDVLQVGEESMVSSACQFEHILNPELTDSICTLLGHPPTCPHGKPIPRGDCCQRAERKIQPVISTLSDMDVGAKGKISFMAPRTHARLDRLSALGFVPGSLVTVHQKRPAFVVKIGETDIAIDPEIAAEIYVRVSRK